MPPLQALQTRSGRLGYVLSGRGAPTLLLFSGAGVSLDSWAPLYPAIERLGTVLAWNRLGVQGSDAPRRPQPGTAVLAPLRELLGHAGLAPPYVLVGHSMGGLHANLFARLHPDEVAGVLFLEATHPEDGEVLRKHQPQLARALERVLSLPRRLFQRNLQAELDAIPETVRQIAAAGPFPPVPLRVVTGGRSPRGWMLSPAAVAARRAHQQALARLSPLGSQVMAQASGHFPQLTEPHVVIAALHELVGTVAEHSPA